MADIVALYGANEKTVSIIRNCVTTEPDTDAIESLKIFAHELYNELQNRAVIFKS